MPDHREGYQVNQTSPRKAVVEIPEDSGDYYANPEDQPNGFLVNGTLPTSSDSGWSSSLSVSETILTENSLPGEKVSTLSQTLPSLLRVPDQSSSEAFTTMCKSVVWFQENKILMALSTATSFTKLQMLSV